MNLLWMGRNRSLEVSPRARLVDAIEADALRRKRDALQWRPRNGFLCDELPERLPLAAPAGRAA